MGKKIGLNDADRSRITSLLGNGTTPLNSFKMMGRDIELLRFFFLEKRTRIKNLQNFG